MKKWNLIIDVAKCFDCEACAVACHDEYRGNEFPGYAAEMPNHGSRWIDIRQREKGQFPMVEVAYLPVTCNHCDDAPCIKAAKDGAIAKRADGIVIIDPVKAKGQQQLVDACPYGAIHWNDEKQLPQAWPFDAHLLDGGWTRTRGVAGLPDPGDADRARRGRRNAEDSAGGGAGSPASRVPVRSHASITRTSTATSRHSSAAASLVRSAASPSASRAPVSACTGAVRRSQKPAAIPTATSGSRVSTRIAGATASKS